MKRRDVGAGGETKTYNSLFCQIPSVFSEKLTLPVVSPAVNYPALRCHSHNILLPSYLSQDKNGRRILLAAPDVQDLTHLLLVCLVSEPLRRAMFDLWSRS